MTKENRSPLSEYLDIPTGAKQYPPEFSEANGAIKLREDPSCVLIGLVPEANDDLRSLLKRFHGDKAIRFVAIDRVELASYLSGRAADTTGPAVEGKEEERLLLDRLANDAPIVNLVNTICIEGIRAGASDIHIEAGTVEARVRYRIDGILKTARSFERGRFQALSSRLKVMAKLNILERRLPQDGRITVDVAGKAIDLRVSIIPVAQGESIVLRLFNKLDNPLHIDELGFAEDELMRLRRFLRIPHGLVLVTGPTGCGKTTTLNAMLRILPKDDLKVITIEDPVEYLIEGISQIQTNDAIKLSFDTILRRVLRQDPNVIMVGEIRDSPTSELAARAALTGHLVLSTLHTNSAISVLPRLRNLGLESYLIASVLKGAVAQRLVRCVCGNCAKDIRPTDHEARILESHRISPSRLAIGTGCNLCGHTGFKGRIAITESFEMEAGLEELILREARVGELQGYLTDRGMRTMAQDGLSKVAAGLTTISELEREVAL